MKLREALIDILAAELVGVRQYSRERAELLVAPFRCERCKHWEGEAGEHDPAAQTTEACARLGFIATAPDFFCAEWCEKETKDVDKCYLARNVFVCGQ